MKQVKGFVAGLLIGALAAGGIIGVSAASQSVTAVTGNYKIMFDGQLKSTPANQPILNYNGRIYTPARFVAETLGATVGWDDSTQTVSIDSPPPTVVEKVVEAPAPTPTATAAPTDRYLSLPVRYSFNGAYIEVNGAQLYNSETYLNLTFNNPNSTPFDMYIPGNFTVTDVNGKELMYTYDQNPQTPVTRGSTVNANIIVEHPGSDSRLFKVVIPYNTLNVTTAVQTSYTATLYVDATDYGN